MTPAARNVRSTSDPEVVRGCRFLGNVHATSFLLAAHILRSGFAGGFWKHLGRDNRDVALRKKTAKLGGNVVLIRISETNSTAGEAYKCEEAPAEVKP